MKVVWTEAALADLDSALDYTAEQYPNLVGPLEVRIRAVLTRIGRWPESARTVDEQPIYALCRYCVFPIASSIVSLTSAWKSFTCTTRRGTINLKFR